MTGQPQKKKLRRVPKVIADELESAIRATEAFADQRLELLARYRRNRIRRIATWGISGIGEPVEGLELIPLEFINGIKALDTAFGKLHSFNNGGGGDYAAKDVETAIRSFHASQTRNRENDYGLIADYLRRRKYAESCNKKALVEDARSYFAFLNHGKPIGESRVRRAIRDHGLARGKKSTGT